MVVHNLKTQLPSSAQKLAHRYSTKPHVDTYKNHKINHDQCANKQRKKQKLHQLNGHNVKTNQYNNYALNPTNWKKLNQHSPDTQTPIRYLLQFESKKK